MVGQYWSTARMLLRGWMQSRDPNPSCEGARCQVMWLLSNVPCPFQFWVTGVYNAESKSCERDRLVCSINFQLCRLLGSLTTNCWGSERCALWLSRYLNT